MRDLLLERKSAKLFPISLYYHTCQYFVCITAIKNNDAARLSAIPGVGKKTAERLFLEMKDKLSDLGLEMEHPPDPSSPVGFYEDALSALVNLGYKKPQAEKALKSAYNINGPDSLLEDLIKESLNKL